MKGDNIMREFKALLAVLSVSSSVKKKILHNHLIYFWVSDWGISKDEIIKRIKIVKLFDKAVPKLFARTVIDGYTVYYLIVHRKYFIEYANELLDQEEELS
jgi:hypothetical protein